MDHRTSRPEFSLDLRVYIEDTDAGGIVYYVNYLKFMERARTEYMRALGYDKDVIFNTDMMFVVQEVRTSYRQPARLDDELQATVTPLKVGGASLLLQQSIRRGAELLAEGEVKIACVDRHSLQPKRMPGEMLSRLRDHHALNAAKG